LALATDPERSYYVPLAHEDGPNADAGQARKLLGDALAKHPHLSAHNGKFDLAILDVAGYPRPALRFDTMLAAYLLGEHSLGLKDLAFNKLGWEMTPITALIGTGRNQITMDKVAVEPSAQYASADVEATLRLETIFQGELELRDQVRLLETLEMPLVPILLKMEQTGIALDADLLREMGNQLENQIEEIRAEIFSSVGHEFNINSPAQLAGVLFDEIGLPAGRKTKTGYSVGQEVLEGLRGSHEAVDLVLEFRSLSKLKSTYVDALPNQVDPETHRVHTTFNQTIAATGRLSSIDPNLQNIPVRTELGRRVRQAFIADNRPGTRPFDDEEAVLFGADYSQMELRIMAHFSGDPALVRAFQEGRDIHATTAAQVFDVPLAEVTPLQRSMSKAVNFGIMYGMSAFGLSRDTGMSRADSSAFIDRYYKEFAGVREFMDKAVAEAAQHGYAATLFGRRRYLPDISARGPLRQAAERAAINMPLQGTAADIMKLAMIQLDQRLAASKLRARLLLQVHDELIFEAPKSELPELAELVTAAMTDIAELSVPMEVETKAGPNWNEMGPLD
jgi:DNA polymerase-1